MRFASLGSPVLVAVLAAAAVPVAADGLYLKLTTDEARVQSGAPVKVKLTAVATRPFSFPATPQFLIDDGTGAKVRPEVGVKAVEPLAAQVSADAPSTASWELALQPGSYRIRVRYKLADRVVESNKVTVEVGAAQATR